MNFKRTVSVLIAVITVCTAVFVTPYSALEDATETQQTIGTEETSYPEETTEPDQTASCEETTAPETVEPETTEPVSTEPVATEPATEAKKGKKKTAKLKINGSTVFYYNKKVLKGINSYRKSKGLKKLTNDENLTARAYARASMLAVNYSKNLSAKAEFPKKAVLTKGATYQSALAKFKESAHKNKKAINACGIANLKVGSERLWVIFLDEKFKEDIKKVESYPKKSKEYSCDGNYYVKYFKVKSNTGSFKNKTVRFKKDKKYSGQIYLKNYQNSVNSYFKVKNSASHTPVKYTTKNNSVATVTPYGNVKGKQASAFKEKSRYTPQKGDFILFHWYKNDGYLANHVGIVYKVTKKHITTIEGNTRSDNYRKSVVSKRVYRNYKRNSQIVGFIDVSQFTSRETAYELADLAKKQIGKRGRNFYNHTKAWKEINGSYMAAHWCAIFCGWLLEQKDLDPYEVIRWSPSCTWWIKQCHKRATAKINAKVVGSKKTYSYKITFKV